MMRTIIVNADPHARDAIRRLLSANDAVRIAGEFGSVSDALSGGAALRPDLILCEVASSGGGKAEDAAVVAVESLGRAFPGVAVLAVGTPGSADFVIRVIRAGAIEFLPSPVVADDLNTALAKAGRLRRDVTPLRRAGRVIAVYSTKGGLGATTLATNLAVSLAEESGSSTVLIDLDTRQSDVTTFLNLRPTYSVVDALENLGRLDDSFLRGLLVRHESGLLVLPGPTRFERTQMSAQQVRSALDVIRSRFELVVLDLRHDLDPGTVGALEAADAILFLTGLDVGSVRSAAGGLAAFRQLGLNTQNVKVVVAREDTGDDVTVKHVRDALGLPIYWKTPSDYRAAVAAINTGQPLVTASPRSKLSKNLRQLAKTLAEGMAATKDSSASGVAALARLVWTPKGSAGKG